MLTNLLIDCASLEIDIKMKFLKRYGFVVIMRSKNGVTIAKTGGGGGGRLGRLGC